MIVSSVTAFHLFNNLLCQHLATLYSLHFHDFVEDSARKSNAAKNVPRTSASHPKYIRVGKMLPVHDSDRCCLSQEHLVMWGCLKRLSSCQEELFFFTGVWCTNHQIADADQTLASQTERSHPGHVGRAAFECIFHQQLISQTLIWQWQGVWHDSV